MKNDLEEGCDIGEEGAAACVADTKEKAVVILSRFVCGMIGHEESEKITDDTVNRAWPVLAREGEESGDSDWLLGFEEVKNSIEGWYFDPNNL